MSAPTLELLLHAARELLETGCTETELGQVRQLVGAALDCCVVLDAIGRDMDTSTPDHPVSVRVWFHGDFNAAELARRLLRGGLQIVETEDGACLVLRGGDAGLARSKTREQLFQAHAIIETVRLAVASKLEVADIEITVGDALQVASRLIDNAASEIATL